MDRPRANHNHQANAGSLSENAHTKVNRDWWRIREYGELSLIEATGFNFAYRLNRRTEVCAYRGHAKEARSLRSEACARSRLAG